jgi:predicted alpha-1,2-mannosidase
MHRLPLTTLLLVLAGCAAEPPADLASAVDPFIGTGGHGHTYPGASVPFGMVQLSPDTRLTGWDGCSGYHFTDTVVYGFSHTHLSGTGVSDYGDVLLMPVTGEPLLENGYERDPDTGYGSRFDKATEHAGAGWYEVTLADYGVRAELTAGPRIGVHRYAFPAGVPAHVIVDLTHRDRVLESWLRVVSPTEIQGMRRSTAWARDQVVYFHARFSRSFGASLHADAIDGPVGSGEHVKAVLSFGEEGGPVEVAVGISAVDAEGALNNLDTEFEGRGFDAVKSAAIAAWQQQLAKFEIEGATPEQRTVFATALYHSFLAPNLFSDVDGRYRGMDLQIHRAEDRDHYTVFSLWDTYRATHPLFTLVERERTREFVQTFLAQYEQGGRLPVWELAANETDCMIGYHSVSVIADAYVKGIRGFDAERALTAMQHSANLDHFGLHAYTRDGFIAVDEESESVSKTLEYAYDDWAIARMAEAMGRDEVAAEYDRRSQAWRHLLDPRTMFLRPRANGGWLTPYDPRRVDFHHTEANGWQYRFMVPHDVESLIEEFGGDESFVAALDSLFEIDSATTGRDQPDITGRIGQYAHGNEPSHHVGWLYHFAGQPDQSARRVRTVLDDFYTAAPDGLIGNEDCGQMSSWYVLSAMGLYAVAPGSPQYVIGPPLFARSTMHLENGAAFTLRARGPRDGAVFVRSATLNGAPIERSFLLHDEILAGGELVLELGREPSPTWGRAPEHRPRSRVAGENVLTAPWVDSENATFRGTTSVVLRNVDPAAQLLYTTDPDRDPIEGSIADGPVVLDRTTHLRFVAVDGERRSAVMRASFYRIPDDLAVEVSSVPNPQYTAGGPEALIDGRRGPEDWRTGAWQGYQAQDFVATVDLGSVRAIEGVGAGFLQDMRSWIWMPRTVRFDASVDGAEWLELGTTTHEVPDDVDAIFREDLGVSVSGVRARYVHVHATNYGTIPGWHPGADGEAFIFVDEILVRVAEEKR